MAGACWKLLNPVVLKSFHVYKIIYIRKFGRRETFYQLRWPRIIVHQRSNYEDARPQKIFLHQLSKAANLPVTFRCRSSAESLVWRLSLMGSEDIASE